LKVTGYINATDLKFIGRLIQNRLLDGIVDLGETDIISEEANGKDHSMEKNALGIQKRDSIKGFIFPRSLSAAKDCFGEYLFVDSVVFDTQMKYIDKRTLFDYYGNNSIPLRLKKLWLGNNVDSIPDNGFSTMVSDPQLQSVHFPKSMKHIGRYAFANCKKLETINIEALANLHYIGSSAFNLTNVYINSYHVPKEMKTFYISGFNYNAGAHIYISKNTTEAMEYERYYSPSGSISKGEIIYHIESETPLSYRLYSPKLVIIPKGSMSAYKKEYYWKDLNLKERNPIEQIKLQFKKLNLEKEETRKLPLTCIPNDAEDTRVAWNSSNNDIVKVSNDGNVTAIKPGRAFVYAVSVVDNNVKDSCEIIVLQHIQSLTIEPKNILMASLGERIKLQTKILPEDATDKSIRWSSSNQSVCTVTNDGTVIATGNGSTVVLAYTNDGNIPATCVVIVNTETSGVADVQITPMLQKSNDGIILRMVLGKNISIYSTQGAVIFKQKMDKDTLELPLPKGIYLIRIDEDVLKVIL
jgi:Ig domain protein group 2 domain protein